VLETGDSFWKLDSKDRFPKLKDFALKMHSTCENTYIFIVLKFANLLFYSLNHFVISGRKEALFL